MERRNIAGIFTPKNSAEIPQIVYGLGNKMTDNDVLRSLLESYGIDIKEIGTVRSGLSVVRKASILVATGIDLTPFERVLERARETQTPVYNFCPSPVGLKDAYQVHCATLHKEAWYNPNMQHGLQIAVQTMMKEDSKFKSALARTD
jgi:hypothetical protein